MDKDNEKSFEDLDELRSEADSRDRDIAEGWNPQE